MSAGSRIFIVVLVLAFLGTGIYYLMIADGTRAQSPAMPAVAEPNPQPMELGGTTSAIPLPPIVENPIASDTVSVRVTVPSSNPVGVELTDRRQRFQSDGPDGVPSGVAEWFPIFDASFFAKDPANLQALIDSPVSYFDDVYAMVVEPHEGMLYMLLYTIPSRSVAPSNYRGVEVLSVSEVGTESSDSRPGLEIELAESAAKRLNRIGKENSARFWAVLVDDVVIEIQRISGGVQSSIMITSGFDADQMKSIEDAVAGKNKIEPSPFAVDGGAVLADEAGITGESAQPLAASRTSTIPTDNEPEAVKPVSNTETKPVKPTWTRYVVQQGDTLASIAQGWFGDSNRWTFIEESNPGLNPNRLSVGQVIMLPQKDTRGVAAPTSPISGRTYQVRSGDSLATISRSCYGSDGHWKVLYEANKAAIGSDPATLQVGTVLSIPALP